MRFTKWTNYFRTRTQFEHIDWTVEDEFPLEEQKVLLYPLMQCQLGENSDGSNLIKLAEQHVANSEDKSYLSAIQLFIKEEQNHSMALGKFLEKHEKPLLQSHLIDTTFTLFRRLYNLEVCIQTLLTAELVATYFYKAVKNQTQSKLLDQVCQQILKDEAMHLVFQCDILQDIRSKKGKLGKWFSRLFAQSLLIASLPIVWLQYRKVLKGGGFGLRKFISKIWGLLQTCEARINSPKPVNISQRFIKPAASKSAA